MVRMISNGGWLLSNAVGMANIATRMSQNSNALACRARLIPMRCSTDAFASGSGGQVKSNQKFVRFMAIPPLAATYARNASGLSVTDGSQPLRKVLCTLARCVHIHSVLLPSADQAIRQNCDPHQ